MQVKPNAALEAARNYVEAKRDAFRSALAEGATLTDATAKAEEAGENALPKRRGGARAGAGRKPTGRVADAALSFRVTSEFKAEFDRKARAAGLSGVEFLKRLVDAAPSDGAR